MISESIIESLKEAANLLDKSDAELMRPPEDVVTLSVCRNAQNAMVKMLQQYLAAHDAQIIADAHLDAMFSECLKINPNFRTVDMANMNCKDAHHEAVQQHYCLSLESVNCCRYIAQDIKSIIWEELQID